MRGLSLEPPLLHLSQQLNCLYSESSDYPPAKKDERFSPGLAFLEEKSLRADVARMLIRLVSVSARISTELEQLKRSQKMSSLWKLRNNPISQ